MLPQEDITVTIGKDTLAYGIDYEIDEGSYLNHINKGRVKVTVIGKGSYGGSMTVQFQITAKKFTWFWLLFG